MAVVEMGIQLWAFRWMDFKGLQGARLGKSRWVEGNDGYI